MCIYIVRSVVSVTSVQRCFALSISTYILTPTHFRHAIFSQFNENSCKIYMPSYLICVLILILVMYHYPKMSASKVITFFMVLLSELAAKMIYQYTSICLDLLLN